MSEEDFVDYDEIALQDSATEKTEDVKKASYTGLYASGFRDMVLKNELMTALQEAAFEHPSEVQQECLPQAIYSHDIICQAKSGTGKTAVFVLAVLQQIDASNNNISALVLCHTRELAYQICREFLRFSKYMPDVKTRVIFGGIPEEVHKQELKNPTHILVGTPGRVERMLQQKVIDLSHVKHFIMDECDSLLNTVDMRRQVQSIFAATPHEKQVMMFTATLPPEIRALCRKFTQKPIEVYVDDETKLTLHGLLQYHTKLEENQKNKKLISLLDALEFNQVVIFVSSVQRCKALDRLLRECNFPSIAMHRDLSQEDRIKRYDQFKNFKSRILVSTDIFGRGVDFEKVNVVINYDMSRDADSYLHRVGRSGRFGTKGLAISFITTTEDEGILEAVQKRFDVQVQDLPAEIDASSYMNA